jgi:hypothetical protein
MPPAVATLLPLLQQHIVQCPEQEPWPNILFQRVRLRPMSLPPHQIPLHNVSAATSNTTAQCLCRHIKYHCTHDLQCGLQYVTPAAIVCLLACIHLATLLHCRRTPRGRKVTDMRPKRPSSSPGPGDSVGSALAAVWPLLVQGDADGTLLSWDLTTGHCSSLPTGERPSTARIRTQKLAYLKVPCAGSIQSAQHQLTTDPRPGEQWNLSYNLRVGLSPCCRLWPCAAYPAGTCEPPGAVRSSRRSACRHASCCCCRQ